MGVVLYVTTLLFKDLILDDPAKNTAINYKRIIIDVPQTPQKKSNLNGKRYILKTGKLDYYNRRCHMKTPQKQRHKTA